MAINDETFEADFAGEGSKKACVTFADGKARVESAHRGGGLNIAIEKRNGVIGNIMVEPGKDSASLVCRGVGEGRGKLAGKPVQRGDRLTGEFCRVDVRSSEVATEEAGGW